MPQSRATCVIDLPVGTRVEVRAPEPVRAALRAAALDVAALYAVSER